MSSSLSIRPVTARWPSSSEVWKETSLPLACVLRPYSSDSPALYKLSDIPKCLSCGSPQQDSTHYPVHAGTANLCHLCGNVTSKHYSTQVAERRHEVLDEKDYRRKGVPGTTVFALPLYDNVYQLPAMTCPPIWWIVVDGTPTCREYWNSLGTSLGNVCRDMPPYIHVGLLVATPSSLAVWDLASAVPHVRHVDWNATTNLPLSPVTSNLQAALRALGDTAIPTRTNNQHPSMPLGDTLQVILDTMQSSNTHPGSVEPKTPPTFAGGKILCILGGPPVEVKSRRKTSTGDIGTGGFGGSCARIGQRYIPSGTFHSNNNNTTVDPELGTTEPLFHSSESTECDMNNLSKLYHNTAAELQFAQLGQQFARAALGVDVLVLTTMSDKHVDDYGISFLRILSDCSGAPGPLLCTCAKEFEKQVLSRTPWHVPTVFGGKLRVRLSPGFHVDSSPVEGTGEDGPQLAPLYSTGGVMGPCCQEEAGLWLLGSCDKMTALTLDLTVNRTVKDRVYVDGLGECAIKHAIQTCFAYTAMEEQKDGSVVTVRRLQIASLHLPLAHDTESLYATLDPEALAVVLFHKLTIASLQDGLIQTHEIGQEWLQSLMSCVYRSAQEEEQLQKEQISRGLDNMNPVFFPQERLLGRNGELSAQDVLLGQGHERLSTVPLVVFALLQCDALRPNMGTFHPSMDARSAASAQMYSMLPSVLARCIAPRLELWDDDEVIVEDLDLNLEAVGLSLMEHRQTGSGNFVLFVDTPREIVVCDSRHVQSISGDESTTSSVVIGKGLERCIEIAVGSYRVPPPVVYELNLAETSLSPLARIKDVLVEDSQTVQGLQNFEQWKQEVAAMVQE